MKLQKNHMAFNSASFRSYFGRGIETRINVTNDATLEAKTLRLGPVELRFKYKTINWWETDASYE